MISCKGRQAWYDSRGVKKWGHRILCRSLQAWDDNPWALVGPGHSVALLYASFYVSTLFFSVTLALSLPFGRPNVDDFSLVGGSWRSGVWHFVSSASSVLCPEEYDVDAEGLFFFLSFLIFLFTCCCFLGFLTCFRILFFFSLTCSCKLHPDLLNMVSNIQQLFGCSLLPLKTVLPSSRSAFL